MKHLYLTRHAKATKDIPGITDFERPLTMRGRIDAPAMGIELAKMKINPELILSSPANRAITTARFIADKLNYPKNKICILEDIYEPWAEDLLALLQDLDPNFNKVMLVGHNPSLQIIAGLLADFEDDHLPTGGVIGIELDIDNWKNLRKGTGKVEFFIYPKKQKDLENEG